MNGAKGQVSSAQQQNARNHPYTLCSAAAVLARLTSLGAEVHEPVKDVGGGIKVASVRDPFGNLFGIIENPHFKLSDVR